MMLVFLSNFVVNYTTVESSKYKRLALLIRLIAFQASLSTRFIIHKKSFTISHPIPFLNFFPTNES